jgi:hypothetical protein
MKRFFGYAIILSSLAIPALAAKNSQSVTFSAPVKIGTTQIAAGEYKVSWTVTGSAVQVTIEQRGVSPVTVPAQLTEAKNGHTAVHTNSASGANVLDSIDFDKLTLKFAGAAHSGE